MKHVGKMKNNSARLAIVYRTLPGDPYSALVVGTTGLTDSYHDSLISCIESDSGQQANELADVLAVRKFPDGTNMLEYLHVNGHLKKVQTKMVIVTPNTTTNLPLDELNQLVADQKGVSLAELAIIPEGERVPVQKREPPAEYKSKWDKARDEKAAKIAEAELAALPVAELTPAEQAKKFRSEADRLAKEAAEMRRKAEELAPTKKKTNAEA
jgi:type IV secretory pathway VirB10-like protein